MRDCHSFLLNILLEYLLHFYPPLSSLTFEGEIMFGEIRKANNRKAFIHFLSHFIRRW